MTIAKDTLAGDFFRASKISLIGDATGSTLLPKNILEDGTIEIDTTIAPDFLDNAVAQAVDSIEIPIASFISVADVEAVNISPDVMYLNTRYHTPDIDDPESLHGGARYRRAYISKLSGYPLSSVLRSQDRYMPDGTLATDPNEGGFWLLDEDEVTPEMFGAQPSPADIGVAIAAAQLYLSVRGRDGLVGGGGTIRYRAVRYRTLTEIQLRPSIAHIGANNGEGPFIGDPTVYGTSIQYFGAVTNFVSVFRAGGFVDTDGYLPGIRVENITFDAALRAGRCLTLAGTQGAYVKNVTFHRATDHGFWMGPRNDDAPGCHHNQITHFWSSGGVNCNGFTMFSSDKNVTPNQGGCAFNYITNGKIVHEDGWGFRHYGGDDNMVENVHIARNTGGVGYGIHLGGGDASTRRAAQGNQYLQRHVAGGVLGIGGDILIEGGERTGNIIRGSLANILSTSAIDGKPVITEGENSGTMIMMTGGYNAVDDAPYIKQFNTTVTNYSWDEHARLNLEGYGPNYPVRKMSYNPNVYKAVSPSPIRALGTVGEDQIAAKFTSGAGGADIVGKWIYDVIASPSDTDWPFRARFMLPAKNGTALESVLNMDPNAVRIGRPVVLPTYTVAQLSGLSVPGGAEVFCSNGDSGSPCKAIFSGGSWKRIPLGATVSAT